MNFNSEKNINVIQRKDLGNQEKRQTFGKRASSIKTKFRENVQYYGQEIFFLIAAILYF
jgi:hypothetical protein